MSKVLSLGGLVSRWMALHQQGQQVSIGELCADSPDLAAEAKEQVEALVSMEKFLRGTGSSDTGSHWGSEDSEEIAAAQKNQEPSCKAVKRIKGYEILEELGRGGMGVVYKARQVSLKRLVALKTILAGPYAGPEQSSRFRSEAEAVARLSHPNVVEIFDIDTYEERPFFSMEFVEGGSLDKKLGGTPMAHGEAAHLTETLARTMDVVHRAGLVHRDLKPENVLLTLDGTPKITDFGLVKQLDAPAGPTHPGSVLGTPSYMAPEQAAGDLKQIGPATDVYALGAILYELLTGRPPFLAASTEETLKQVCSDDPVSPRDLQPGLPRDLDTICLKCLEKEPGQRYASALALAEDLHRFLEGKPILARPVRSWERLARWARRQPLAASLAGLCVTAVVGIVTLLWWQALEANRHAQKVDEDARGLTKLKVALEEALENEKAARAKEKEALTKEKLQHARAEDELARHRALYVNTIDFAATLANKGHFASAIHRLKVHSPPPGQSDLRCFAWKYLWRLCQSQGSVLPGPPTHPGMDISPDGKWLAAGGKESAVHVWDLKARKPFTVLSSDKKRISVVRFSPDGKFLAAADADVSHRKGPGRLSLWAVDDWKKRNALDFAATTLLPIAFSPDSKTLAVGFGGDGAEGGILFYDVATQKVLDKVSTERDSSSGLAFSPDGDELAAAMTSRFRKFNLRSQTPTFKPLPGPYSSVAYSPDGKLLAAGPDNGEVVLIDLPQNERHTLPTGSRSVVESLSFSPDGRLMAMGTSSGEVQIWDPVRRVMNVQFPAHDRTATVKFTPDGRHVVSAGYDGTIKFWDVDLMTEHKKEVWAVIFSRDGQTFWSAGDDAVIRQRTTATGKMLRTLPGHDALVSCLALSPDGRLLASGSYDSPDDTPPGRPCDNLILWDTETGKKVAALPGHRTSVRSLAFSPDGRTLASGSRDHTIKLWNVKSRELIPSRDIPLMSGGWRSLSMEPA
jgi:WD40 repeat protein